MPYNSQNAPTANSQILRAHWHDYRSPGCYLITIVTEGRCKAFGRLEGDSEEDAHIHLNSLGMLLDNAILAIPTRFPEIEIIERVVMEDHCHISLQVKTRMAKHLGAVVGFLKNATTKEYLNGRSQREQRLCLTPAADIRDERRQRERIGNIQAWLAEGAAQPPATKQYEIALAISRSLSSPSAKASLSEGGAAASARVENGPAVQLPPLSAPSAKAPLAEGSAAASASVVNGSAVQLPPLAAPSAKAPLAEGSAVASASVVNGSAFQLPPLSSPSAKAPLAEGGAAASASVENGSAVKQPQPLPAVPVAVVPPLWAKGYHDRIVTRMGQVAQQKAYIHRNAARLWLKRHSDRLFTKVSHLNIPVTFSHAQALKDFAVYWDQRRSVYHSALSYHRDGSHYAESYVELVQHFLRRQPVRPVADGIRVADDTIRDSWQALLSVRYCGNQGLIYSGRPMVRIRISRSVTEEQFEKEVNRVLDLCEHEGAIAVSPFRSWSEKTMLRILRMNGYDHVIIHGESMWDGWKPQDGSTAEHNQPLPSWFINKYQPLLPSSDKGDLQEVYAGHCAFLSLWHDRPKGERAGKADCEIMNEVALLMEEESKR